MRSNLFSKGALAAIVAAPLVLVGCGGDSITGSSPSEAGSALVRVAHLSPDAPAVDVLVNGARVVTGAAFGDATGYLALPAGSARIQVVPAGASSPVVIDATLDLASGAAYTVAATGFLGAGDLKPLVLSDDLSGIAGQAKVRFVHASPDAPAVDIAVTDGPVLFANVSFRGFKGYAQVPGGAYNLEARPAGTTTAALKVPDVVLGGAGSYTIFAIGSLGKGSLSALALRDAR